MNKGSLRSSVLLSVQRALVGEIDPYMRAVSVEWDESRIRIHVYYDGLVTDEALGDFDAGAVTQVVADFPYPEREDPSVEFDMLRCDSPSPVPARGVLVFARKGETFDRVNDV